MYIKSAHFNPWIKLWRDLDSVSPDFSFSTSSSHQIDSPSFAWRWNIVRLSNPSTYCNWGHNAMNMFAKNRLKTSEHILQVYFPSHNRIWHIVKTTASHLSSHQWTNLLINWQSHTLFTIHSVESRYKTKVGWCWWWAC